MGSAQHIWNTYCGILPPFSVIVPSNYVTLQTLIQFLKISQPITLYLSHEIAWMKKEIYFGTRSISTSEGLLMALSNYALSACLNGIMYYNILLRAHLTHIIELIIYTNNCQNFNRVYAHDGPSSYLTKYSMKCILSNDTGVYYFNMSSSTHQIFLQVPNSLTEYEILVYFSFLLYKNITYLPLTKDHNPHKFNISPEEKSTFYNVFAVNNKAAGSSMIKFHLLVDKWNGFQDEQCTYGGIAFFPDGKYHGIFLLNIN